MTGDTAQAPAGAKLTVEQLAVVYDRSTMAIQGVSLEVPPGAIVAVLGSNGAGKSTTLRAIGGFLAAERAEITEGHIRYGSDEITGVKPYTVAKRGIVLVPERQKVFETLTVKENLDIGVVARRTSAAVQRELFEMVHGYFPILAEREKQEAGYLSGGERQMLAIAKALMSRPQLLMIDELSLGLAPTIVTDLLEILQRINREQGTSILFVEQNAAAALEVAHYAYIMESGRIVLDGPPEKLAQHEDVKEFYLGIGGDEMKSYAHVKQYKRARRWFG